MFALNDFNYHLPEHLIAQTPARQRDHSRLLVLNRADGAVSHGIFADVAELLNPSDLLVINDTRVMPARLFGKKETGGNIEVLIIGFSDRQGPLVSGKPVVCECLVRTSRAPKPGMRLDFGPDLKAVVMEAFEKTFSIAFMCEQPFETVLDRIGKMPLPPYIRRSRGDDGLLNDNSGDDHRAYQTVYAAQTGAVAAPTAGLHFTWPLLKRLEQKGIEIATITLHVGYGTFAPVKAEDIRDHRIHTESYFISPETADAINMARRSGRRIIAVGTTTVRTLEYAAGRNGMVAAGGGECDLFIYPGYEFNMVDAMITNFHLPKSTLLMLVSAFAGRERILNAYQQAIENQYRFYSYGDAMLII
jgi:S-adenosylmethionine:tRNA ribosyltransferase-isomerase